MNRVNIITTLCCVVVFVFHQIFELYSPTFLNSYLDDLLFFPVVFGIAYLVQNGFYGHTISNWFWFTLAVIVALVVEEIYSRIHAGFTYDLVDYLFYGVGFIIFLIQTRSSHLNQDKLTI